jgi:hypothetical protein
MTTASATLTYVYGVVPAPAAAPDVPGIDGAPVTTVTEAGLAAVVGPVAAEPAGLGGREAMAAHARVLEAAFADGPILPMRFGTVLVDAEAVRREVLERHREHLSRQLSQLAGTVEFKLRATYEEDQLLREVISGDPVIAELRERLRDRSPDATYYARIELGERVAAAVERHRERDAAAILDRLAPYVRDVAVRPAAHERIALDAALLVDRERIAAFDEALEAIGRDGADRLRLKLTGPLPPHSFVGLEEGSSGWA